jgi:hypothetical protein
VSRISPAVDCRDTALSCTDRLTSNIPNGTYPEERLINGAIGAVESPSSPEFGLALAIRSAVDFDTAWPLIWPQKTVLFQTDDEYYNNVYYASNGFLNSKQLLPSPSYPGLEGFVAYPLIYKPSLTRLTAATATILPSDRRVTARNRSVRTPCTRTRTGRRATRASVCAACTGRPTSS